MNMMEGISRGTCVEHTGVLFIYPSFGRDCQYLTMWTAIEKKGKVNVISCSHFRSDIEVRGSYTFIIFHYLQDYS